MPKKLVIKPKGTLFPKPKPKKRLIIKPKKKIEKPEEPPAKAKPKMPAKKRLIITKRLPPKLPNFERYLKGKEEEGTPGFKLTQRQRELYRQVFDRELLLREVEGKWEGGASKESIVALRKEYPHLQIKGIDY